MNEWTLLHCCCVEFEKNNNLTLRIYFKKYCLKRMSSFVFSHFQYPHKLIFPKNFTEINQISQRIWTFTLKFCVFWIFLPLLATKKLMVSAFIKLYQQFFDFELFFTGCLRTIFSYINMQHQDLKHQGILYMTHIMKNRWIRRNPKNHDPLREKLCFTQISTWMAARLPLNFFTRLHNQLSSIHSIITY